MKRRIRIFAEFGSTCLWDEEGVGICVESLTGQENEIDDKLMDWCDKLILLWHLKDDDIQMAATKKEREDFDREGLLLARELKSILGDDYELTYEPIDGEPVKL